MTTTAEDVRISLQESSVCWGAKFNGGTGCTPDFVPGKLHFKNKFCDNCRNAIMVPRAQVHALSPELAACFVNKRSEGFWNHAPAHMGGGRYRIINNTAGCIGPWLVLFRDQPPQLNWLAVPEHWASEDGNIRLCVAKGTLVPAKSLRCGQPQASARRRKVESTAVPQLSLSKTRASLPPIPGKLASPMVDAQTDQVNPPLHAQRIMACAVPVGPVVSVKAMASAPSSLAAVASPIVGGQRSFPSVQQGQQNQQGSQDCKGKLQNYKARLQILQSQEMQEGESEKKQRETQGEVKAVPPVSVDFADMASVVAPEGGAKMPNKSQQPALYGNEARMPSQQVSNIPNSAAIRPGTPQKRKAEDRADELFTNVPRGERTASTNELGYSTCPLLGQVLASSAEVWQACQAATAVSDWQQPVPDCDQDMTSVIEAWRACQAAGGFEDDLLDASRFSSASVSTCATVDANDALDTVSACPTFVVDGGGLDEEFHNSLDTHTTAAEATNNGQGPMPDSGMFEMVHSAYRHLTGTLHTLLEDEALSDVQRELVCDQFQGARRLQAELILKEPFAAKPTSPPDDAIG